MTSKKSKALGLTFSGNWNSGSYASNSSNKTKWFLSHEAVKETGYQAVTKACTRALTQIGRHRRRLGRRISKNDPQMEIMDTAACEGIRRGDWQHNAEPPFLSFQAINIVSLSVSLEMAAFHVHFLERHNVNQNGSKTNIMSCCHSEQAYTSHSTVRKTNQKTQKTCLGLVPPNKSHLEYFL